MSVYSLTHRITVIKVSKITNFDLLNSLTHRITVIKVSKITNFDLLKSQEFGQA